MEDKRINILEDIQGGMSPTYLGKFNKISGLDIDTVPGTVFPEYRLREEYPFDAGSLVPSTFTASTDDTITLPTSLVGGWAKGQAVTVSTTGTLPAGLTAGTVYYAIELGATTLKLANSLANLISETPVDITDTGSGTHTITPAVMGIPYNIVCAGANIFMVDMVGAVWYRYSNTNWVKVGGTTTAFKNITIWKNYLLAFGPIKSIEVFGPLTDISTAGWKTWETAPTRAGGGGRCPNVVMSNDILYIGDDNFVGSFEETVDDTFDPTDETSYVWSPQAVNIPKNKTISALTEYNYSLAIGAGRGDEYAARIYFWDTFSPSFDVVLDVNNSWVQSMIQYNGLLYYITAGSADFTDGIIYVTNGSSAKKAFAIPKGSSDSQQVRSVYPFQIFRYALTEWKDKLLVGVSGQYGAGIYAINPNNGSIVQSYTDNSGNEGVVGRDNLNFYTILPQENNLMIGVNKDLYDGVSNVIEVIKYSDTYRVNTDSYFETGLMTVDTKDSPRTFEFFEVQLGKELAANEVITLYYRVNFTDTWTTIGAVGFTADGAVASKIIRNSTVRGDQIQFKCIVTVGSSATTGPEIKAIYIY